MSSFFNFFFKFVPQGVRHDQRVRHIRLLSPTENLPKNHRLKRLFCPWFYYKFLRILAHFFECDHLHSVAHWSDYEVTLLFLCSILRSLSFTWNYDGECIVYLLRNHQLNERFSRWFHVKIPIKNIRRAQESNNRRIDGL